VFGGGGCGFVTAWATNHWQRAATREARVAERRAAAYLEVVVLWNHFIQASGSMVSQEASPAAAEALLPQLSDIARGRATLSLFGSGEARQFHALAFEASNAFIEYMNSLPRTAAGAIVVSRDAAGELQSLLGEVRYQVDSMERQMHRELQPEGENT
jgi:hypothetical protein